MNIKRSLIGFFMLTVIAFFSGCIGKSTDCTLDCRTLNETVKGIEILYIYEEHKKREVLYILEEDEIPTFLEEFCGLTFQLQIPPQESIRYTVKLLYHDGSFDLISAWGGIRYNKEGEFETHVPFCKSDDRESYYNLLLKYIKIDKLK